MYDFWAAWIDLLPAAFIADAPFDPRLLATVYEITNKKQVFSNTQITNHITEIVSLGGTAATETQERMRREGFEFIINADGSITQKSKTQENKWVYKVDTMEFVDAKKKK